MNRIIFIGILIFSFKNLHAQKKEYYTYVNANFEVKNDKNFLNINNGATQKINLFKLEPIIGVLIDLEYSAISLGIIVYGWSEYIETLKTTSSYSENIIKTNSYGLELSYIFKLYKTRNRSPFVLGLGINFNYQYILYNRKLDSYTNYQDNIHINEKLKTSVLSSGLFIMLEQKVSKKMAINFNIGNRFYLPLSTSIYNYSNNHYLLSLGVKYKL